MVKFIWVQLTISGNYGVPNATTTHLKTIWGTLSQLLCMLRSLRSSRCSRIPFKTAFQTPGEGEETRATTVVYRSLVFPSKNMAANSQGPGKDKRDWHQQMIPLNPATKDYIQRIFVRLGAIIDWGGHPYSIPPQISGWTPKKRTCWTYQYTENWVGMEVVYWFSPERQE